MNDIGMLQGFQNLDFPESRNGKAVLFRFGVDAFESDNFFGGIVLRDKYGSVGSLSDLCLARKDILVS